MYLVKKKYANPLEGDTKPPEGDNSMKFVYHQLNGKVIPWNGSSVDLPLMVLGIWVDFGFKLHKSTYITSYSMFCVVVVDFVVEVVEVVVVVFIGFRMG